MSQGRFILVKIGASNHDSHYYLCPPNVIKHISRLIPLMAKYNIEDHKPKYIIKDTASPINVSFLPLSELMENEEEFARYVDAQIQERHARLERERLAKEILNMPDKG